jgi:hypothetical protein
MNTAIFSNCRSYRFTLWRDVEPVGFSKLGYVQIIGLNPSTADEVLDDPTIRRCRGFTASWGYSRLCMTNIFPFRATDPIDMKNHVEALEARQENAQWIAKIASEAALVLCAWGVHGAYKDRGAKVLHHLRNVMKIPVHHLGLTKGGHPKHPLYLKVDLQPIQFA